MSGQHPHTTTSTVLAFSVGHASGTYGRPSTKSSISSHGMMPFSQSGSARIQLLPTRLCGGEYCCQSRPYLSPRNNIDSSYRTFPRLAGEVRSPPLYPRYRRPPNSHNCPSPAPVHPRRSPCQDRRIQPPEEDLLTWRGDSPVERAPSNHKQARNSVSAQRSGILLFFRGSTCGLLTSGCRCCTWKPRIRRRTFSWQNSHVTCSGCPCRRFTCFSISGFLDVMYSHFLHLNTVFPFCVEG